MNTDAELVAAAEAKAITLRQHIPVDHEELTVTQEGDLDGWPIYQFVAADGTEVNQCDATIHGVDEAIRRGALGAFLTLVIASISKDRLVAIQAEHVKKAASAAKAVEDAKAERKAKFELAKATGQPIELEAWMEFRRVKVSGEWGDYQFACSEMALPDGTTKKTAFNCY